MVVFPSLSSQSLLDLYTVHQFAAAPPFATTHQLAVLLSSTTHQFVITLLCVITPQCAITPQLKDVPAQSDTIVLFAAALLNAYRAEFHPAAAPQLAMFVATLCAVAHPLAAMFATNPCAAAHLTPAIHAESHHAAAAHQDAASHAVLRLAAVALVSFHAVSLAVWLHAVAVHQRNAVLPATHPHAAAVLQDAATHVMCLLAAAHLPASQP